MTETVCAQCGAPLAEGQGVAVKDRVFCRACYEKLAATVRGALRAQSEGINYPLAVFGALGGGAVGAAAWVGSVILTAVLFRRALLLGPVALVIGYAVGKGIALATGGKRSRILQYIAAAVALGAYGISSVLIGLRFDAWDLIFGGIAVWQAWIMPRPIAV